jgi:16S rRNA C967 or C1407 C5-methylase (RsmB/RsmF family)/NOL1/NOP2/fmu family ribosome biogenesis protein
VQNYLCNMFALPEKFIQRILSQFPHDGAQLLSALEAEPKTSIHIHAVKGETVQLQGQAVPWFSHGKILHERPSFTLDPLFHAGSYYPQESSSMFLHHVLKHLYAEHRDITCLDLCAAPGGKSILLSTFLKDKGRLISNELIRTRNSILRENLTKWGADNAIVTCNDPNDFKELHNYFDCVVADAPCSGEGMFRKDAGSRNEWSMDNVNLCSSRQKRILEDIAPTIKTGGHLIYSTCTFAPQENEEQIAQLLATGQFEEVMIPVPAEWHLLRLKHGLQFLPHKVPGEGFYMAVLRKTEASSHDFKGKGKPVFHAINKKEKAKLDEVADTGEHYLIQTARNEYYASSFSADELNQLVKHLYITMPGVELGEYMKDELIPSHALAMSLFQLHNTPKVEVDLETALQYLRGEALQLQAERGRALITYSDRPLGWIKVVGNRTNNNYPKEWRIRMR